MFLIVRTLLFVYAGMDEDINALLFTAVLEHELDLTVLLCGALCKVLCKVLLCKVLCGVLCGVLCEVLCGVYSVWHSVPFGFPISSHHD